MKWLRKSWRSRQAREETRGTFVADIEWHRSEELRPDRLGLTDGDKELTEFPHDPWRPQRTLGPL